MRVRRTPKIPTFGRATQSKFSSVSYFGGAHKIPNHGQPRAMMNQYQNPAWLFESEQKDTRSYTQTRPTNHTVRKNRPATRLSNVHEVHRVCIGAHRQGSDRDRCWTSSDKSLSCPNFGSNEPSPAIDIDDERHTHDVDQ